MKTLYVHIGLPKTATTSIQRLCVDNRSVLEKKGYCYPDFPYRYKGLSPNRNALFLASAYYDENGVRQTEREDEIVQEGLYTIQELFQKFDNIILSDEGIWFSALGRRTAIWHELKDAAEKGNYTVKIIVYLRRQDEHIESRWNQRVKHDHIKTNDITWTEFIDENSSEARFMTMYVDYDGGLQNIENVIGKENIIVRRFNRKHFIGGSIQADFLHAIGLELTDEFQLEDKTQHLNLRLSGNTPEIKRIINSIPDLDLQENRRFEEIMLACSPLSGEEYPCNMFSAEEAAAFVQRYADGNQKIADRYFHDGKPLFDSEYKETIKWEKNNPYYCDDIVRFAAVSDLYTMRQIEKLQQQINAQTKELHELKWKMKHPLLGLIKMIRVRIKKKK